MNNKKALIFGVTGQDGSYLADFLLEKNYQVVGVSRRTSTDNKSRIQHILHHPNFSLQECDITDAHSVYWTLDKHDDATEIYNLAAQSFVGVSFRQPGLTWDATGKGCLNILQSIVDLKLDARFYQASSSEMFGSSYSCCGDFKWQDENTKFLPQSPYAIAKCAAHYMTRLYREAYGLHASAGILFNHETLSYSTPIIIKKDNKINILPIGEVARFHTGIVFDMNNLKYQEGKPCSDLKIWDQSGWVDVSWVSGYPHEKDKNPRIINARNFVYTATGSHPCIMDDGSEKNTSDLKLGDKVKNISYPDTEFAEDISLEEAEWLGMMVGDGNLRGNIPRFTNKNALIKERFKHLWISFNKNGYCKDLDSYSGFTGDYIGQIDCYSDPLSRHQPSINYDIYCNDTSPFGHKNKKVPQKILNASTDVMEAFLIGYNACDGLKVNPCKYKFKNFKTNSPTLAAGLLFLISKVTGQKYNITVEESWKHGKQQFYYSINLLSSNESSISKFNTVKSFLNNGLSQREIHRQTGISRSFIRKIKNGYIPENNQHLQLCSNEIKKIIDIPNYDGWFFDLETSSGTFHAGIGQGVVHNSPRRGEQFVTRKITKWIGEYIKHRNYVLNLSLEETGLCDQCIENNIYVEVWDKTGFPKLRLGNLDAYRDWGHAADFVEAMWMMLQQDQPDDYIICTGETHTVREFLDAAFGRVGIDDWSDLVIQDPEFYRPAEVDYLRGTYAKAKNKFGWTPKHSFTDLVNCMVDADLQ